MTGSLGHLGWSDLRGARVGLWGLGVEGQASLRRLRSIDVEPASLVDDHPSLAELGGRTVLPTGAGGLEQLATCEVVVKSPGISRYRPEAGVLTGHGVAVVGGLGLWLEEVDGDRAIGVTGTKGKSTSAAIIGHLLSGTGHECLVVGNIGCPPYDPDLTGRPDYREPEYWVVEVSSFQATDLTRAPAVVAVTSLYPDHLDWHGDVATYYRDKLSICTRPGAAVTVADGDSETLQTHRDLLGPDVRWVTDREDDKWVDALGLLGPHNRRNAQIARACLEAAGIAEASDGERLAAAAAGFEPLASRLQTIAVVGEIEFVDDGLSTNVLPTLAALDSFDDRPVALLVGGFDRGIDYRPLARRLRRRSRPTLVLTLPDNGPRVRRELLEELGPSTPVTVEDQPDMRAAVAAGFGWSPPGGVILLSPAAPSFGRYQDYRERSFAFAQAVATCRP